MDSRELPPVTVLVIALLMPQRVSAQPNIVLILADDLDLELNGTLPLSKTRKLIAEKGAVFKNMYVTNAHNCPSRASVLSGMYPHNHGVINNSVSGGCSGQEWREKWEKLTIPNFLQGYRTCYAGVYLDAYGKKGGGGEYKPGGWDCWKALVGESAYYNYTLIDGNVPVFHSDDYSLDYFTDVVKNESVQFIRETPSPFFLLIAPPACSAPFTPAPQYKSHFGKEKAPRTKSYNVPGKDKHWLVASAPNPMSHEAIHLADSILQNRWRTLLSLDDLVDDVVRELSAQSALDNTYIFFTSDSGYHLGQFSLPNGNRQLYEFDIHVPLFVRGPTIAAGTTINTPVLNIDLAPTIADLASGSSPSTMDGKSFTHEFHDDTSKKVKKRDKFLILHHGQGSTSKIKDCKKTTMNQTCCLPSCVCEDAFNNSYSCVRLISASLNTAYCEFSDNVAFVEVYNLLKDPFQLKNVVKETSSKDLLKYHNYLLELAVCKGVKCV